MSDHVFPEQACYVNCNFCNTPLVVYTLSLSLSQHSFVWATESLKESNRVREKNEEGNVMGNCSLISHCLLQVNVPGNNSFNVVTVRCGLCASLLSVDLEALLGKLPHQSFQWAHFPEIHFGSSVKRSKQV
ncbi:hypothetical protein GW17_00011092 [Ensete ventricosum]|nr:hypothetical protein GW17_00011092 [Ensete ventricosum]